MPNDKDAPEQPPPYNLPVQNFTTQAFPPLDYPPNYEESEGSPAQTYEPPIRRQLDVIIVTQAPSPQERNKPQSKAVCSAGLIFLSGGMNIAWSIGFRNIEASSVHVTICWFLGATIGAFCSGLLAYKWPKKYLLLCSSLLVIIGGVVLASTRCNELVILGALYLDGFANGLIFAPIIALIGEVSVSYMRGFIASFFGQFCCGTGVLLQIIYSSYWTSTEFEAEQLHGILSACFGFVALLMCKFWTIESPVIMLANGQEEEAAATLCHLQSPGTLTSDTFEQLAEHKLYLEQNMILSIRQSIFQALPALLRIGFLRALDSLSISYMVVHALSTSTVYAHYDDHWTYFAFAFARWIGQMIVVLIVESSGRKALTLVGLGVCAGLASGVAIGFCGSLEMGNFRNRFDIAVGLLIAFQIFAGISATSAYLSECYPLVVKPHFIAFTYIIEMLLFIIVNASLVLTSITANQMSDYFFILAGLYIFGFLMGIFCLPETKRTTLSQAQDKFKSFLNKA